MRVTVDGRDVEVPSGASVLSAVRAVGRDVPSLCWDPRTSPGGSCRTCLVAVDGDQVVASMRKVHYMGPAVPRTIPARPRSTSTGSRRWTVGRRWGHGHTCPRASSQMPFIP
jgi:2Fe-2S iron-sulfur cluster binding domain